MFGLIKKKHKLLSPFSGKCVPLNEVPDEAFAQKLLGDGIAIIPSDGKLVSPVDCTVEQVFDTKHAYSLKDSNGLEILIHIGINTVELNGEGFDNRVTNTKQVKSGDLLSNVDLKFISEKGYSIYTPVVFINHDKFNFEFNFGPVVAGKSEIAIYESK